MNRSLWELTLGQRQAIWDAVGYEPTEGQYPIVASDKRLIGIGGGERGGKSQTSEIILLSWVVQRPYGGLFWIVGPDYDQARAEFKHLLPHLQKLEMLDPNSLSQPKNGAWECRTRRISSSHEPTIIQTRSSSDVRTIATMPPDGILMVEAAQQEEEAYFRCAGRVAEKRGPLVLSGTFEQGVIWYAELFDLWKSGGEPGAIAYSLPTWSNTKVFPGGRQDPEILRLERTYPRDVFLERFGGIPCPPHTIVFREFDPDKHVKKFAEFDYRHPVQLWIDPGYDHPYAVLAVQIRRDLDGCPVYHFDEVYERGLVAREMIRRAKARHWWRKVSGLVMDVAGRSHPGTDSQAEIWSRYTHLPIRMQKVGIADGILRHRTFLMDPALEKPRLFHNPRCKGTIREYRLYKRAQDSDKTAAREVPIDRNNDAMKALAYGLVVNFGHASPLRAPRPTSVSFRRG